MPDIMDPARQDDAPLATSKHASAAVDVATDALIEPARRYADRRAVTINRPRNELFAYWRDFANLATFMDNVERVDVLDDKPLALGGQGARRQDGRMGCDRHRGDRGRADRLGLGRRRRCAE
jgi:hypothetical protein